MTTELVGDLDALFCTNKYTEKCWCMWHIISVKAFHAGGAEQNRAQVKQLSQAEETPLGIIAYQDGEPVGWCAVGPRERYARAIKTPSYKYDVVDTATNIWLVPCFFVRADKRGDGITNVLLEAAIRLAIDNNAGALDGFPFTNAKRRSSSQIHVGFASTFLASGFRMIGQPSESRVVMRLFLAA